MIPILKQQRLAGQSADRRRSRRPAAAAAAAASQGAITPTPKDPAPRRGPTPGWTQDWLDADTGGSIKGCFSNAAWYREEAIGHTSKASGAAPKDMTYKYYSINEKKRQNFDI
eukprot:1438306-Pyramimonas_sp.AAC.1